MKRSFFRNRLLAGLLFVAMGGGVTTAFADGTETLGTPSIPIAEEGTGIVAAGVGLADAQAGTINIDVPGEVVQVLLYWGGSVTSNAASDNAILVNGVNGVEVVGDLIGGPAYFFSAFSKDFYYSNYRADITDITDIDGLPLVDSGMNSLTVEGLDNIDADGNGENSGAGVLVIFDDGSTAASIQLKDGLDLAFNGFPEPRETTVPQTLTFAPAVVERTADLVIFAGSVGEEGGRTSTIVLDSNDGDIPDVEDALASVDGDLWDTLTLPVKIPANATELKVQILSGSSNAGNPASLNWIGAGLSVLLPEPGIDIEKFTNGNQADGANDGDVPQIPAGDTVTWTYKVTNTGDVPFAFGDVAVTDDQSAFTGVVPRFDAGSDDGGDGVLSPGEMWQYTAELPAENLLTTTSGVTIVDGCDPDQTGITRPTYENIGTVVAGTETDSDPSHYCNPPAPGIDIEKLTNDNQADGANDSDVPQIAPGETVTWTYVVTNTGNVPFALADVTVTDDQPGVEPVFDPASDDGDGILSPNEMWNYTAQLPAENLLTSTSGAKIVPGCDPDNTGLTRPTYENVGTVVVGSNTDFDPSHYCNPPDPGIDIEKLTDGNQADGANDGDVPQIAPGATVTWTYRVTNTGNVPFALADVSVTDDQSGSTGVTPEFDTGSDDGDNILSPMEVWLYSASAPAENLLTTTSGVMIVDGCDPNNTGITRPTYENIGTVMAGTETDFDPSHYCNPPEPGIDIEKLTDDNQADGANDADVPQIAPGETVTWTYVVTNTGEVPFAEGDVIVTDDQPGVVPAFVPGAGTDDGDGILSPDEVWNYTAELPAENLLTTTSGVTIVEGCDPDSTGLTRPTYENIGTVVAGSSTDFDPSHYCNPPPEAIACRVTGGLNDTFADNRYQAGGQAGANTGAQPQPKGEWTHHQQNGPAGSFTFHGGTSSAPEGTEIDEIRCSDPGGCGPSGNPPSPAKQLDFDGIGTFKNIGNGNKVPDFVKAGANATEEGNGNQAFDGTFHWFEVNIDDLGEPGNSNPNKNPDDADPSICPLIGFGEKGAQALANCSCSDFYRITIYDGVNASDVVKNPDGSIDPSQMNRTDVIYEVWGYLDGGNLQIHQPTGFDMKN